MGLASGLHADLADPEQHLVPQANRHRIAAAVLGDEALHRFLESELPQARPAFLILEVLPDLSTVRFAEFTVEVGVNPREYLAARDLVWPSAAHDPSFPDWLPEDDPAEVGLAEAPVGTFLTIPRSAA